MKTLNRALACVLCAALHALPAGAQQRALTRGPVIDVHLHGGATASGLPYKTDSEFLQFALAELRRHNVVLALTSVRSGPQYIALWRAADPERVVVGPQLTWRDDAWPDTAWLRREFVARRIGFVGELGYVYLGLPPTDPRVQALFALAHEFDVPVAAHIGMRPRESLPSGCCPNFDDRFGDPALLRPILQRFPGLRLYLMHVGGRNTDYFEHAIELMREFPNVYGDMSVVAARAPREVFHSNLRRLIEEGLLDRIMFGSDGAAYIGANIDAFEAVPFLTEQQKRAIFYDNAARFLRLDPQQIERHHRGL